MLAEYVFKSKYARHNAAEGRRETWSEAVERTAAMHRARFHHELAQVAEVQVRALTLHQEGIMKLSLPRNGNLW